MHSQKLWEAFLLCRGCRKSYDSKQRSPMLLTCGHTFCKTCCIYLERSGPNGKVRCPEDREDDFRDLKDISASVHYLQALDKVEVGCYWHFCDPGVWYCPDNLIPACDTCKTGLSTWTWTEIAANDLAGSYVRSIQDMLSTPGFREYIYNSDPELRVRCRLLSESSAREKERLYFALLSYREKVDYFVPSAGDEGFRFCKMTENRLLEVSRFTQILPSPYTLDYRKVQKWLIASDKNQAEALTFTVSKAVKLHGLGLGKECESVETACISFIALLPGSESCSPYLREQAANVAYTSQDRCIETVMFYSPVELQANSPYTIKIKYVGQGVYYGDPLCRTDVVRGPDGLEIRFLDSRFVNGEYQNGNGRLSGPILKLYVEVIHEGEDGVHLGEASAQ